MTHREGPTSAESGSRHSTIMKEKASAKLSAVKEKLSSGHTGVLKKSPADHDSSDRTSDRRAAEGAGQKLSIVQQLKDKMPGPRNNTHGMAAVGRGLGYEKAHDDEDLKVAEHGNHLGEKLAHMMPGPPYVHRHRTNDYEEGDD